MLQRRLARLVLSALVVTQAPLLSNNSTASAATRVVCLGDSLTEGFGIPSENAWPELLQQSLRQRGWADVVVVNAGVSGSTSASALSRLQWQLRSRPDILVLALGANDGLRGVDPQETKKNLAATIDLAKSNGMLVLLAGMRMPPNYGGEYTQRYEQVFASLAADKSVAFLPFLLEGVAADPSLNLPDGIHPNEKGHAVLATLVERHLVPLLEERGRSRPTAEAVQ